ncbi:MAG TPA: EAL domain-containing protein [Burkholderiales bacterium]|jgi:diguanylate cyclase (GGDEF)-like protein/PAS domain S-box-containing protein|nr:EAL domain-containing protein [Burkholderiales bacterium]
MAQNGSEYTIQEAAAKLGIPVQKLRRWDVQGVLVARRTGGGHRRYAREIIDGLANSAAPPREDRQNDELAAARKSLKEKRRVIQLLLESEARYRDLVETSHDLIWTTDALGRFTYLNNGSLDIFGLHPKDLIGRCFFDFEARPSHISNRRFLSTLRKHGEVKDYITHLIAADGSDRWVGINARVSYDDDGRIVGLRGTARNITEQHRSALQIEYLATHDSLTGLPNRVSLQRTLEAALASGEKGAVLQLDIDHFKYVNDNFGHRAGDQLLIAVGGVLKDLVKERNAGVFRLGGDEFALHLPDALRSEAISTAEAVLDTLRRFKPQMAHDTWLSTLSASIGIATYPFQGGDVATLLANVDIAMYQAKDDGRNRFVLHDITSEELRATHRRVHWARELRQVLDQDRITVWSQPVVRLSDRQTVHHELLARISDRNGEVVLPAQFIQIAEELGLVREIDLRVVEKLLGYLSAAERRGQKARYFVNLSRASISDPNWVQRFRRLLESASVTHSQLVFEITETAAMANVNLTQRFIADLRRLGCRFALDDFGAGFSSFYYLKRFDVDYLKIDGSFVQEVAKDDAAKLFVRALCDVAMGLNKQVIAEWVESPAALEILAGMGVEYAQGHLFGAPKLLIPETPALPADEARSA